MAIPRVWGQVVGLFVLWVWELLVRRASRLRPFRYLDRFALRELLTGDHRSGTGSGLHWKAMSLVGNRGGHLDGTPGLVRLGSRVWGRGGEGPVPLSRVLVATRIGQPGGLTVIRGKTGARVLLSAPGTPTLVHVVVWAAIRSPR